MTVLFPEAQGLSTKKTLVDDDDDDDVSGQLPVQKR